jgi:3-hydroxyisobutyrate dehydrogenase-like beta-hydroxyacid dehydrogenase
MAPLAFIGTGLLGAGMVENFLKKGHSVTVWNRTEAKAKALEPLGARVADTPEAAAAHAERVHLTLSDDAAVDPIVDRLAAVVGPGVWIIDHTTTSPDGTRARYDRMQRAGALFAHAPVFMGPQNAREATGLVLTSGPRDTVQTLQPWLAEMAAAVIDLGERRELASIYKLIGNSMLFVLSAGLADVFSMARAQGVAPSDAIALFQTFPVGNMINVRGAKMAAGDYTASFELTMARKDMRLMIEAAAGQALAVWPAIAARMDAAIAAGHGHEDMGAIAIPDLGGPAAGWQTYGAE